MIKEDLSATVTALIIASLLILIALPIDKIIRCIDKKLQEPSEQNYFGSRDI
jgi:hypothetical protein